MITKLKDFTKTLYISASHSEGGVGVTVYTEQFICTLEDGLISRNIQSFVKIFQFCDLSHFLGNKC
jgi:hypothetical protein